MFGLSPLELLVCLFIVVLLFGVRKLPELGSGLGQGISNFRRAFREGQAIDVTPPKNGEKIEGGKTEVHSKLDQSATNHKEGHSS